MQERQLTIKTNFNNKLACDRFIHIVISHPNGIPESANIVINTADKSHGPVKTNVIDSIGQKFKNLSPAFIYLSHGMDPDQFYEMVLKEAPAVTPDTEMKVYFFKKITA